ncbi:MAG: flagellar basal-body rod protein FlgF [Inquilinus sp.]|nr:flagellar basal-body rod protein FlgF [Inquilinus sp.]
MENPLYIGLSRQQALQRQLAVTANNIANANTAGFKAQRVLFQEYLADGAGPGRSADGPLSMVIDRAVMRDLSTGAFERTGNPLDVAVMGAGYMVVETDAGPRYTRTGRLAIDAEGQLVDGNRLPILADDDRPIQIPADAGALSIGADGSIGGAQGPIGRIRLVAFADEGALVPRGGGLLATNELPADAEGIELAQGMLERSNVKPILEMTRLIEISRQYQANQRLLETEHGRQRDSIRRLAGTQQS